MVRKFLLLASMAAVMSGPVQAEPTASITDQAAFAGAISAIRADDHNYDKFKEPITTDLIGKSFAITMPLDQGSEGHGTPFYDYKDGKLILDVSPGEAWPFLVGPKESLPVLMVSDSTKTTGKYIGQNAFGVTAEVTNFSNVGAGIAIVESPKPMLSPMRVSIGATNLDDSDWWIELPLPPSEAKALASNSVAIVQGAYSRLANGSIGFCHKGVLTATIDKPSNYSSEKCFIGAKVTRIALIDKRTNTVLKEWTNATAPRLGPELWQGIRAGMNMNELKAAQPTMTDYRSFEASGLKAMVEMEKGVAAKVRVWTGTMAGPGVVTALTQRYGQPVQKKCYVTSCEGKWRVNEYVDAYLSLGGDITYQLSVDEPPVGFRQ